MPHQLSWSCACGRDRKRFVDGRFDLPPELAHELGAIAVIASVDRAAVVTSRSCVPIVTSEPWPNDDGDHLAWKVLKEARLGKLGNERTHSSTQPKVTTQMRVEIDGKSWPVGEELLLIGRHAACHIRLDDSKASALHCVLHQTTDGVRVLDLGATNGTFLDGTLVTAATIRRRAILSIGDQRLTLLPTDSPTDHIELPSPQMHRLRELITRVAATDAPVLIEGESGVGKEDVARRVHLASGRLGPLITLNAGAISPSLAGSELFGHVRGAFTGADNDRDGAFVTAQGGTLFLDEVAELPLAIQAELLRVVEHCRLRPIGDNCEVEVDVRLVTATNKDLALQVREGAFRADLFHRICVVPLHVPPLRERPEDLVALAKHFLLQQTQPRRLSRRAWTKLKKHPFRGNVRELFNVIKRACTLTDADVLGAQHLPLPPAPNERSTHLDDRMHQTILDTYDENNQSVARTAMLLGIHRATIYRHLRMERARERSLRL